MSQRQVQKVKQIQQMQNIKNDKEEIEEEEYKSNKKQFFNAFAFEQDENEDEEDQNEQQEQEQQIQQQKKKKNKKKKKKKKEEEENEDNKNKQDLAYLDEMIKEVVIENDDQDNYIMKQQQQKLMEDLNLQSILQLNIKRLNYNKELKKYFKSEDMEPEQDQNEQMGLNRQQKKRLRQIENQREYKSYKQYYLIYNLKVYKNQVPDKFECEYIDIDENGHKVYKFSPSMKYESLQQTYLSMKNTLDPNNIFIFHQQNPFHSNCLYDIAEYLRMQANYKDSNQLLESLLFIYEESMNVEFKQNIFETSNGSNQYVKMVLKYDDISELFYKGLLKFIDVLVKKGCYQAAMEYNKVLLKLNPTLDPVGALLCIDFTTLLSRNYTYLQHFIRSFTKYPILNNDSEVYRNDTMTILYLPNMIYSCSLAKYLDQQQKNNQLVDNSVFTDHQFQQSIDQSVYHLECSANTLLILSILLYPSIIKQMLIQTYPTLFNHTFYNENNKSVQFYEYLDMKDDQDVKGLERIISIYERNQPVWRQKEVGEWARKAVIFILNKIDQGWDYDQFIADRLSLPFSKSIPFQLKRYAHISKHNFTDDDMQLDLNNIQDEGQQQMPQDYNPINLQQNPLQLMLDSLLPWVHLPNQNNVDQQDQE